MTPLRPALMPAVRPRMALSPAGRSRLAGMAADTALLIRPASEDAPPVKSYSPMPAPTPAATLLPVGFMRVEGDWIPRALLSADSRLAATVSASVAQPASVMPCATPSLMCWPVPVTSRPFKKVTMFCRLVRSSSLTCSPCWIAATSSPTYAEIPATVSALKSIFMLVSSTPRSVLSPRTLAQNLSHAL